MRLKEDPMRNGQTKPAYNLQIMTSSQYVLGYDLMQNPTDTRTLIPFLTHLAQNEVLGREIVADAGYGSERNYKYIEDELPDCKALIPYSTMIKENSRKWRSDDRKVMNWEYHEADDYYLNPQGVRFNFKRYAYRNDKYKFHRDFKVYQAEKYDENHQIIPQALTPRGNTKYIMVNQQWEYFKSKARKSLSNSDTYSRRKYDVETVFGNLKAYLGFKRFMVRGLKKAKRQIGIALMALNMKKMAGRPSSYSNNFVKKEEPFRISLEIPNGSSISRMTCTLKVGICMFLLVNWINIFSRQLDSAHIGVVFGCLVLFEFVVHCRSEAIPQWPGLIQLGSDN